MGMPKNSLRPEQIQIPGLDLVRNCLLMADRAGDPAELKRSLPELSCIRRFQAPQECRGQRDRERQLRRPPSPSPKCDSKEVRKGRLTAEGTSGSRTSPIAEKMRHRICCSSRVLSSTLASAGVPSSNRTAPTTVHLFVIFAASAPSTACGWEKSHSAERLSRSKFYARP